MLRGWLLIIHVLVRANQFNEVSVFLISEIFQERSVGNFGAKRALMGEKKPCLDWGNVIIRVH